MRQNRWITFGAGTALSATLFFTPAISGQVPSFDEQITNHQSTAEAAHARGDLSTEADEIILIGNIFSRQSRLQQALAAYERALAIAESSDDAVREGSTLNRIGLIEGNLGMPDEAILCLKRAMPLEHKLGDWAGEAYTLGNIGRLYSDLGQPGKALEYYRRSLPLARHAEDQIGMAGALHNIGAAYSQMGKNRIALTYYFRALTPEKSQGGEIFQARTLSRIGLAYIELKQNRKAASFLKQALFLDRKISSRESEIYTLERLGNLEAASGHQTHGLAYLMAASSLAEDVGNPDVQGAVNADLMVYWQERNSPEFAIFFGTRAINAYQGMRTHQVTLDHDLQASFVSSKAASYRKLAELLISQNRLAEAEHVLNLLKYAELRETVRGNEDDPNPKTNPLPTTDITRTAESSVASEATIAASLIDASFEFDRLKALTSPTPADKSKIKSLSVQVAAGNLAIETFFNKTLFAELGNPAQSNPLVSMTDSNTSGLSDAIAQLEPGTLGLYTLIGDQHSYIIVVTAETRESHEIKITAAALKNIILDFHSNMESATGDATQDFEALDRLLIDPIAGDIAAAGKQSKDGIPTLLWSLDGLLRYVPISALYDSKQPAGRKYLVERARNVLITPESISRGHLAKSVPSSTFTAAAFGISQSLEGRAALNAVPGELDAIVHDPKVPASSHGVMGGNQFLDIDFTLATFKDSLRLHPTVIHIASHFIFPPSDKNPDATESYLLLSGDQTGGSGYHLTLSKLKTDQELKFNGVRLLTLSACDTAIGNLASNGREIDSLAMVAEQKQAVAVLATLWSVADISTAALMSDFYRRWTAGHDIQKIEALRQAQLSMLHGGSGNPPEFRKPFYWAPFVLIGNYY